MLICHKYTRFLLVLIFLIKSRQSWAKALTEAVAEATSEARKTNLSDLMLITDDVIQDAVEKDIKKVIRVNPVELPSLEQHRNIDSKDSDLYKIQSLAPYKAERKYTNIQRSKPLTNINKRPLAVGLSLLPNPDKAIKSKHRPKQKNLHFLYNQKDLAGNLLSKSMRVHITPGAYPVYYVVDRANGRFGKYPLKSFGSPQAFQKYLHKNKLHNQTELNA